MTYVVLTYDNFDPPRERCCSTEGEFATSEEAIACAKGVVDESLNACRKPEHDATQWYGVYSAGGDGVYLQGEPRVDFNPYTYAMDRIEQLIGERPK